MSLHRSHFRAVRYADDFVVLCKAESEQVDALDTVHSSLVPLRLQVNSEKTRLTTFEEGFDFLGVRFKEGRYSYLWNDKRVLAEDLGETFPLEIDGYGW